MKVTLTTQAADRLIKAGKPVEVQDVYGDVFRLTFVGRKGRSIFSADGGKFDRSDLTILDFD